MIDFTAKSVDHYSGSATTYQVVIPKNVTEVQVTLPKGTDVSGQELKYSVASASIGWDYASGITKETNEDGSTTMTIAVADYTDTDTGVMLQSNMWYPTVGFDFVVGTVTNITDSLKTTAKYQIETYKSEADRIDQSSSSQCKSSN